MNIDVSSKYQLCAFNANRSGYGTGVYVNLKIEGNNSLLAGKEAAALGFSKATPNIDGETNGSTLTIGGNGKLYCQGGVYALGIGSGYNGNDASAGIASNIIINSGYIETKGGTHGSGIGAPLSNNANNIIINGGEVYTYGDYYGAGIGATGIASNISINGGTIYAYSNHGNAIGGKTIENLQINGGEIYISKTYKTIPYIGCIGGDGNLTINGGTIHCNAAKSGIYGIYGGTGSIKINGGSTKISAEEGYITSSVPTNESGNLYLTEIQLQNISDKTEITSITTSDNINYGTKDVYTTQDDKTTTDTNEGGRVYLYLPLGSRTITVKTGNATYSGTVETTETSTLLILNKQ